MTALLKTARPEDVFQDLFRTHESDQIGSKYRKRLAQVAITNGKSLIIDFDDLISFDPALARSLVEKPDDYITYASSAATAQMRVEDPEYAEHVGKIFARFRRLPEKTALRKIGAEHIKKIALVDGIVVRTTQVKPTIVSAVFRCRKCLEITVLDQEGELIHGPGSHCQFCKQSTSFELLQEQSKFKNTQEARIQERPEDLPPGQLPRYLEVRLEDDLVDSARPGDRVSVTSIVRAEKQAVGERGRLRTFNIYLDANFVDVVGKETEVVEITPEDEKQILEAAQDPWVQRKLVMSLAPSIYGYEDVKEGILYLLFGGTAKQLPDGVNIRGDENVLLIGDPGTAKSQLLQYVSRIAPRGLYTSGRGTTAAGLTAAVLREKTGGMILEAGALVLADKGVACLHPDSQVLIDGISTRIGHLFDAKNAKIAVTKAGYRLSMSVLGRRTINLGLDNLQAREAAATLVTMRDYEGPLVCLGMKSGFGLRVTPDHLLLDGPRFSWRPAREIRIGDRLLTIQRLPQRNDRVRILDILPDDWIVQPSLEERAELRKRVLERFRSFAAASRHYGLRREALTLRGRDAIRLDTFRRLLLDLDLKEWRDRAFAYGRRKKTERFQVAHITPDLAYILGFIYGDGYARSNSKHSIVRITQSDLHRRHIDRLQQASQATFNTAWHDSLRPGTRQDSFRIHNLRRDSNLLFALYDWTTRNTLENLLRFGQDTLAGFLAGCMDADGCVSTKHYRKSGREYRMIDITFSLSDDLDTNRMLLLALRRFDVYARIRQQKGVKIVQITGRDDATRLVRVLSPYSIKCEKIPVRSTAISSDNEEVPAPLLAQVLKEIRPVPSQLLRRGSWSTFYELRAGTRRPFKSGVRRLRDTLDEWLSSEQAASLSALSASDYAMDEVISVKVEYYKGPVYDLRVPEGSSFLADGVCVHNCIDELDKMRPDDRVAIHEALEQQTVSVAKGGIVATLNARAAVLAAANPSLGRYEPHRNVSENINLPVTILSRFDLIFIIKDQPEPDYDSRMSEHILALHRSKVSPETAPFAPDFLRKYISFAKRITPVLTPEAVIELRDFYLKMRSKGGEDAAVAITPRQLEALVRISEARARAFLRDTVTVEDAKSAIRIMTVSLSDVGVDVKTGAMDIDVIMTGKPRSLRDSFQRVIETVAEMERETGTVEETVLIAALVDKEKMEEREARRLIGQLIKEGILYSPKPGRLKRTAG